MKCNSAVEKKNVYRVDYPAMFTYLSIYSKYEVWFLFTGGLNLLLPLLHAKRCPYTHAQMHAGVTHTHAYTATTEGAVYETPSSKISSQGLINFVPLTVKPLGIYNPTPPLPCGQMSHLLPCALEVTYMVPTMPLWALSSSGAPSVPCPGPGPRCVLQALLPSLWPALSLWPPFCPQHCW